MTEDQNKFKKLFSKTWKAVLGLVFISFLFSITRDLYRVFTFGKKISDSEQKIQELKIEKESLERQLRYLSSDGYKEIQIRDKLSLAKEDEIVVVLPDEETLRKLSPRKSLPTSSYEPQSNWEKWRDIFFDI